ncbi:unnamed protein product [Arabis nemorensis]|uniref:Uncharacterized protein n=1 Tax=Arabis nemorensis TaxID=586526 RepID=A0A565BSY0_9BRAS|nr:unnamed protein product [Arabis nemorensis]
MSQRTTFCRLDNRSARFGERARLGDMATMVQSVLGAVGVHFPEGTTQIVVVNHVAGTSSG